MFGSDVLFDKKLNETAYEHPCHLVDSEGIIFYMRALPLFCMWTNEIKKNCMWSHTTSEHTT